MDNTIILTDFVQQILLRNHIPVHVVTTPCEDPSWLDQGLRKTILNMDNASELTNHILESVHPKKIYYITDDFECSYVLMSLPDSEEILVCGPVLLEKIDPPRLTEIMDRLKIPYELHDQIRDYYYSVTFFPLQSFFLSLFTLLAENIFGKDNYEFIYSNFDELDQWYQTYTGYFRIPEKPFLSIQMIEERYSSEAAIIDAVTNGNETKAMEMYTQLTSRFLPSRLTNSLRDQKDYCITLNTLLRKAAEMAGVHPIHIDTFSNKNVQTIERLTSIEQCKKQQQKTIQGYCRLVRTYTLKNYSLLTQKVITYVDTDLSVDLSLKSLSEALSVNASYLSTLFRKEMGIPLTDYVNRKRIQHAQRLLLGTDAPIKTIAQQCGIPDIYYFSRLFKKIVGTTPKVYRETATYNNFHSMSNDNMESSRSTVSDVQ